MAQLLKDKYRIDVAEKISKMIFEVHSTFDREGFICHVQKGYEQGALAALGYGKYAAVKIENVNITPQNPKWEAVFS